MGFFSRRPRDGPVVDPAAAPGATNGTHSSRRRRRGHFEPYTMMTRPTFGQWLKLTWLDIVSMAVLGAIGLGVYMAHPAPTRSFAVTQPSTGDVVYPEFAYPLRKEIVPIWAAALLASLVPIAIILLMQIRIRSFWDVNNAVVGLLYSLITAAVFQVFIKWLIGGLRPHFLDVCKPDLSRATNAEGLRIGESGYDGKGFQQMYYTMEVCTGDRDQIDDALESMPSGHTTAAFAGFVFLSLYLNAKLKVWSNYHPAMWKLVAIWAPVLGACLIGGALTIDEFHNWYDVLAGAVIGTVMAFSSYRMVYASIWDWRFNHIPLNRSSPMMFGHGGEEVELSGATFTRRVGWGLGGAGFPFGDKHGFNGQEHGVGGNGHHDGHLGHGSHGGKSAGLFNGASRKPVASGSGSPAVPTSHGPGHLLRGDNMV